MLASDPFGAEFRELFQPDVAQREAGGNPFHRGLCQGLYDADFLGFFNGPAEVGQPTYASHFYDPDTGTNWWGRGTLTALQRGRDLSKQLFWTTRQEESPRRGTRSVFRCTT